MKPPNADTKAEKEEENERKEADFFSFACGIFSFLEKFIWPLHLDKYLISEKDNSGYDAKVKALTDAINSRPAIRDEWMAIEVPGDKSGGEEAPKISVVERVRLFGPARTRAYLVGAMIRMHSEIKFEKTNWLVTPLPNWRYFERIFGNDETSFGIQLECAVIFEVFQIWLKRECTVADAARARRWLDKQIEVWAKLWRDLSEQLRSGTALPVTTIFRTRVLLDIGRATMNVVSDKALVNWSRAESSKQEIFMTLFTESETFGFCSAQVASVWAQCMVRCSGIATVLRLLMRPWQVAGVPVHSGQFSPATKAAVDYFSVIPAERKAAA